MAVEGEIACAAEIEAATAVEHGLGSRRALHDKALGGQAAVAERGFVTGEETSQGGIQGEKGREGFGQEFATSGLFGLDIGRSLRLGHGYLL
jgi:hypothetical protein